MSSSRELLGSIKLGEIKDRKLTVEELQEIILALAVSYNKLLTEVESLKSSGRILSERDGRYYKRYGI